MDGGTRNKEQGGSFQDECVIQWWKHEVESVGFAGSISLIFIDIRRAVGVDIQWAGTIEHPLDCGDAYCAK